MSKTLDLYHGHLEAMLARHWPELVTLIDVRGQRSWMTLLQQYAGPHMVAAASEAAAKTLDKASRGRLGAESIKSIVESARTTLGVPMIEQEEAKLQFIVLQIERETRGIEALDELLAKLVAKDEVMSRLAVVVGPACAAAVMAHVGSPLAFETADALEKATGLNLKEKSSGNGEHNLHITKRGPAQVRQLLFLASLRLVQSDPIVAAWYRKRKSYTADSGKTKIKAVVAVMRKLVRALWHVARGAAFDASKLFDVRGLDIKPNADDVAVEPHAPASARTLPSKRQRSQGGAPQQTA